MNNAEPNRSGSIGLRLAVLVAALAFGLATSSSGALAYTDYSPGESSYYQASHALTVGPNGVWMRGASGLNGYLALSDASGHYSVRTGFSRVLFDGSGTASCGTSDGCAFFDEQSTSLDWNTSCTVPNVSSGYWATLYVSADAYDNSGCSGLGSNYAPVWVIALNSSNIPNNYYAWQHMVRHEMGHALSLHEASKSCEWDSGLGLYVPLMNNSPCSNPYNYWLTNNEVSAIISRNGWY